MRGDIKAIAHDRCSHCLLLGSSRVSTGMAVSSKVSMNVLLQHGENTFNAHMCSHFTAASQDSASYK